MELLPILWNGSILPIEKLLHAVFWNLKLGCLFRASRTEQDEEYFAFISHALHGKSNQTWNLSKILHERIFGLNTQKILAHNDSVSVNITACVKFQQFRRILLDCIILNIALDFGCNTGVLSVLHCFAMMPNVPIITININSVHWWQLHKELD